MNQQTSFFFISRGGSPKKENPTKEHIRESYQKKKKTTHKWNIYKNQNISISKGLLYTSLPKVVNMNLERQMIDCYQHWCRDHLTFVAGICDELTMPYTKLPRRCLSIHLLCISTKAHYLFMMEHKINCLLFQSMFKREPLRIKVPHIGDNYHCIPKKMLEMFCLWIS